MVLLTLSDSYCCISYSQLLNDSSKLLVSNVGSSSLVLLVPSGVLNRRSTVGVVFCRSQVQSHVDTVYTVWLRQLLL